MGAIAMGYLRPTNLPLGNHLDVVPETLKDLIPADGDSLPEFGQYQFHLSFDEAASLGYPVAKLDEQFKHEVILFQAARFLDISHEKATYRYGAALEAIITVSVVKGDGSATLAAVAASVQLSNANATSSLSVRGYLPQAPLVLPEWGEFDVGAYSKFQQTVTDLQGKILFDNPNIRPQLLATTVPEAVGEYGSALGQTFALDAISHGWSLQEALGRLDSNSGPDVRAAVEKVYEAKNLSDSEKPSSQQQGQANADMKEIHVPVARHWLPFLRERDSE